MQIFIAALFVITPNWKQHKWSSTDEDKQMWYIHIMKYYSSIKRNELLMDATMWMNLKIILLSERSKYCIIPFIQNSKKYSHVSLNDGDMFCEMH